MIVTYEELLASFKKGLRNGNWRKRNFIDKALFRASLWYAKHRGSIVNTSLVEKLLGLVERLKEAKEKDERSNKIHSQGLQDVIRKHFFRWIKAARSRVTQNSNRRLSPHWRWDGLPKMEGYT